MPIYYIEDNEISKNIDEERTGAFVNCGITRALFSEIF
jgi:hypothetical protein